MYYIHIFLNYSDNVVSYIIVNEVSLKSTKYLFVEFPFGSNTSYSKNNIQIVNTLLVGRFILALLHLRLTPFTDLIYKMTLNLSLVAPSLSGGHTTDSMNLWKGSQNSATFIPASINHRGLFIYSSCWTRRDWLLSATSQLQFVYD